ncbi:hypothetical protein CB1_000692011 [Camelus ferus]|nr:hypothetical protein CB1_000692011 [Camelus ferus]
MTQSFWRDRGTIHIEFVCTVLLKLCNMQLSSFYLTPRTLQELIPNEREGERYEVHGGAGGQTVQLMMNLVSRTLQPIFKNLHVVLQKEEAERVPLEPHPAPPTEAREEAPPLKRIPIYVWSTDGARGPLFPSKDAEQCRPDMGIKMKGLPPPEVSPLRKK